MDAEDYLSGWNFLKGLELKPFSHFSAEYQRKWRFGWRVEGFLQGKIRVYIGDSIGGACYTSSIQFGQIYWNPFYKMSNLEFPKHSAAELFPICRFVLLNNNGNSPHSDVQRQKTRQTAQYALYSLLNCQLEQAKQPKENFFWKNIHGFFAGSKTCPTFALAKRNKAHRQAVRQRSLKEFHKTF